MSKVIVIANQKGGVAKTTTTASFGAGLALKGYNVLLIDTDPQGNLSDSLGADNETSATIYEVMKNEVTASEAIQHLEKFDIIPSNLSLASADIEFTDLGKEHKLKEALESLNNIDKPYDYIIIDTPPVVGIVIMNAFTCADEIIIPVKADIFSASGITQLYQNVNSVKKYSNSNIIIAGILFIDHDSRTNISKDIEQITSNIAAHINVPIYKTTIRHSIKIKEAQANNIDIFQYDSKNNVAVDYLKFTEEYLKGDN